MSFKTALAFSTPSERNTLELSNYFFFKLSVTMSVEMCVCNLFMVSFVSWLYSTKPGSILTNLGFPIRGVILYKRLALDITKVSWLA